MASAVAIPTAGQEGQDPGTITVTAYDESGQEMGTVSIERSPESESNSLAFNMRSSTPEETVMNWDNVRYEDGEVIDSFEDGDLSEYTQGADESATWTVSDETSTDGQRSLRGDPGSTSTLDDSYLYYDGLIVQSDFSFDMMVRGGSGGNSPGGMLIFSDQSGSGYQFYANNYDGQMYLFGPDGSQSITDVGYSPGEWYTFEVEVTGEFPEPTRESTLSIETRDLYQPGVTHEYTVYQEIESLDGTPNESVDVTENATVTTDSSLLTVNDNQTMTATAGENESAVVNVTAEYEGENTTKQVVVARPTVQNLEILPTGITRVWAVGTDNTIFALLIAAFMGVAATRYAGAFAGLATAEMVIVIGWLGGYVGLGMAMVSVFMAMFIGLNLAANIDYSVTRR